MRGRRAGPRGVRTGNLGRDGWSYNHASFPSSRMKSAHPLTPPNSRSFQTSGLRVITTSSTGRHCSPQWLRCLPASRVGTFHPGFQFWTVAYWGLSVCPQTGGSPCNRQLLRGWPLPWSWHRHSSWKPEDWQKQTRAQINPCGIDRPILQRKTEARW